MLSSFYVQKILSHFEFEPSKDQNILIEKLGEFLSDEQKHIFILKGYAGTGKTTILSALVKSLAEFEINTVLLAPTGRAAKVFSAYSQTNAYTIHKEIYALQDRNDEKLRFVVSKNENKNTIFIVDEASMISNASQGKNSIFGSGNLLDDFIKYVFSGKNCRLILSGDTAQLPPVGLSNSPALERTTIEAYGKEVIEYQMTEVIRQAFNSGILYNATKLRQMIADDTFGSTPHFELDGFDDIQRINGMDLIDSISTSYSNIGIENTIVVTRSNNRANRYNQGIRSSVLYREDLIGRDDRIMVVRNNYLWPLLNQQKGFIANGDIGIIDNIRNFETEYGLDFADAEIYFSDLDMYIEAKIMLSTLNVDTPALPEDTNTELWQKIQTMYLETEANRKKAYQKIRKDPHLNALQIKYAYAVTCHKSQGGQWDEVYIDYSYISDDRLNKEYYRWLYTALTRAISKVYLVNFPDKFFE